VLAEKGAEVDVRDCDKVWSLEGCSAVVLGTAIRLGRPVRAMRAFQRRWCLELSSLPTAVFSLGATPREGTPEAMAEASHCLAPLVASVKPISVALFAGKLDPQELTMPWRKLVERGEPNARLVPGDWRDWNAIDDWARDLAGLLAREGATADSVV
jgi:menaquinone-dependent protoporphyrinogen oxidase